MSLKNLTNDLTAYNVWANHQIIVWIKDKSPEILTQKIPSSFSTIKSTFLHIWNAERFWLSFLKHLEFEPFRKEFDENFEAFFEGIINQSLKFETFAHSLTEEQLEENRTIDTPWLKGTLPVYDYIQHAMNHSTYHRGQLITMGRMLGLENPPNTDFTNYKINKV